MGEIRSKRCEGRGLTKDQLARLDSAVALTLADGTRLLTALVSTTPWPAAHGHRPQCPWCLPRNPTDIALFRSTNNRTRFTFLSWVATAAATRALGVQEGANEHAAA